MLATVLVSLLLLGNLPQNPLATDRVATGAIAAVAMRGTPDAVAVRGTTELTAAEAFATARSAAVEVLRTRWAERGQRLVVDQRPFWLPELFAQRAVSRWLGRSDAAEAMTIVDREERAHEHEFGRSFQTTLWIAEDPRQVTAGERQLRRELAQTEHRLLATSAATVVFWAVLGVVTSWLDRLSRGYMTGRLRCIGLLLGAAMPTLAFLL